MRVKDKIRYLSRDIIKTYVFFVRGKIVAGDIKYIESGIDVDFSTYENLFFEVLRYTLDFKTEVGYSFPMSLINECASELEFMLVDNKYKNVLKKYTDIVFDTCNLIFRFVEEGIRKNEYKKV